MEGIPAVQESVASMLLTLGDGNWKMGEGAQVGKGQKLGEGDESIVLEHYLCRYFVLIANYLLFPHFEARRCYHDYHSIPHGSIKNSSSPTIRCNLPSQQHFLPPGSYYIILFTTHFSPRPTSCRLTSILIPYRESSVF